MNRKYIVETGTKKVVKFRIAPTVADDLNQLRDTAKQMQVKLTIDKEIESVLKKMLKEANEELSEIARERSNASEPQAAETEPY